MRAATGISELGAAYCVGSSLIRSSCRTVNGLCQSVLVEAQLGEETMRLTMLALFLIFAGTSAFATAAGQDQNAQASGPLVTTILKTDVAGVEDKEREVITVELAPGTVDARHIYSGVD